MMITGDLFRKGELRAYEKYVGRRFHRLTEEKARGRVEFERGRKFADGLSLVVPYEEGGQLGWKLSEKGDWEFVDGEEE